MPSDVTRPRCAAVAQGLAVLVLAVGAIGCAPGDLSPLPPPCNGLRPLAGDIVVAPLACEARVPQFGEGQPAADLWLATEQYRAVLRHAQDSLTVRGVGGATLVDLAPWPGVDTIHEIVPIVGGGWLVDVTVAPEIDGYTVSGTVAALPGLVPTDPGARRTVRYRASPDAPFLDVEGAEGFRIHPLGDEVLYDGFARTPGRMVGAQGEVVDAGGGYDVFGTDRLVVGLDPVVWAGLAEEDPQTLGGTATGAEEIVLFRGGREVGRIPIASSELALVVPADIDGVRSEASGYAPSPVVPPGSAVSLVLGAAGSLAVAPVWEDGRPHWLSISWTSADARAGIRRLGPDGGTLALGAGTFDLVVSAGPAFETAALHVELRPDEVQLLPLRLPARIDPGSYVLAGFRRPSDRSRDWRGSDATAAAQAAADGLSYATFTPLEDVSSVSAATPGFPPLLVRNGVTRAGDGYTIASWSWSSNDGKALHGAPIAPPRSPTDEAAAMSGGPGASRILNVDLGWLSAAGLPPLPVHPDQVWLDRPRDGLGSWSPWFDWLDRSRPVIPTGPWTWVHVEDPLRIGIADIEQALARGDVCAGTGPRLALLVDQRPPGEEVSEVEGPHTIAIGLEGREGIDHLALVTEGGATEALPLLPLQGLERMLASRWVLVAAWSDDPEGPWAVTGPVWLSAP